LPFPSFLMAKTFLSTQAILATQFNDFVKGARIKFFVFTGFVILFFFFFILCWARFSGDAFQIQMKSVLGTGVFNSDGMHLKVLSFYRKLTQPHEISGDMWKSVNEGVPLFCA